MNKLEVSENFNINDIYKIREYHYETTKNMTKKEKIKEINDKAEKLEKAYKSKKDVSC